MHPLSHSLRVTAQAGWHTVHALYGTPDEPIARPLDDMDYHTGQLRTLSIHAGSCDVIRDQLGDMGIHHATVYGDFQSVCLAIARKYGFGGG